MANVTVRTRGLIFDEARRRGVLQQGIRAGTQKLIPRVVDAVQGKLDSSLKEPTGKFRSGIKGQVYASGFGVVKSTDPRRRKTWIERRTRGGVRLGKGSYAFRAGKKVAREANKQGFYQAEIARRLRD